MKQQKQSKIVYPTMPEQFVYPFCLGRHNQQPTKQKSVSHLFSGKKPNKYKAKKTVVDGITFVSKKESKRYGELKILESHGVISGLKLQPAFVLLDAFKTPEGENVRAIKYIADFSYERGGKKIVEDTKGVKTDVFKLKRKLFLHRYPQIELRII